MPAASMRGLAKRCGEVKADDGASSQIHRPGGQARTWGQGRREAAGAIEKKG